MADVPAVKIIALLKRKAGMSREDFIDYYENHHVPLVLSIGRTIAAYRRNYVKPSSEFNEFDSVDSECDVITEAWFNTPDDLKVFQEDATRPEVREAVIADELNFLDRGAIRMFVVEARDSVIGQ